MAASLVPRTGGSPIVLDKPIVLIGRHQDCDAVLQTSSKVSRRHCCVARVNEQFVLRDLGSMNGVRVNGNRVVEALLKPGDEVAIGDILFNLNVGDASSVRQVAKKQGNGHVAPAAPRSPDPANLSLEFPVAIDDEPGFSQDMDGIEDLPPVSLEHAPPPLDSDQIQLKSSTGDPERGFVQRN